MKITSLPIAAVRQAGHSVPAYLEDLKLSVYASERHELFGPPLGGYFVGLADLDVDQIALRAVWHLTVEDAIADWRPGVEPSVNAALKKLEGGRRGFHGAMNLCSL